MERIGNRISRLLLQMFYLLMLYTACRLVFVYSNSSELSVQGNLLNILVGGMRFDASSMAMSNALYILMMLLPAPFVINKLYRKAAAVIFVITNSLCLLSNLVDVAYFPFIHKRSQADALDFITGEKGDDLFRLAPTFLREYWYLLLLFVLLVLALVKIAKLKRGIHYSKLPAAKYYPLAALVFLLGAGLTVLALRGGLQEKPLDLIHASEMTAVKNIAAIINTPFSIIKTVERKELSAVNYFDDAVMASMNQGIRNGGGKGALIKKNVVLIIIESLSRKHMGYFGGKARTPFLDSLFNQSLVFTNGFANAKESIEAVPAIISSIPSLQDDPFIFSPYTSNRITSLPALLKESGYHTSFFHGGFNGTMAFDSYAGLAGFDAYYGRNEFANDKEYDGNWGIWDEPFLQFMAAKLNSTTQPFFSTVFTLNPHHPFALPAKYKNRFNANKEPLLNCIEYVDYALSRFFHTIRKEPWFDSTLFVITADHTAPVLQGDFTSAVEDYRIPIAFYAPGFINKTENNMVANQVDIVPTILHLLGYPGSYFSYGSSLLQNSNRYSVNYNGSIYQYIDDSLCYQFNGQAPVALYNWRRDSSLTNNLYTGNLNSIGLRCDTALKKYIQLYNSSMINNKMHISTIQGKP